MSTFELVRALIIHDALVVVAAVGFYGWLVLR